VLALRVTCALVATQNGSSALHLAASRGRAPAMLALLRAGADPTATNRYLGA
jgi:ankyrin repeat protein